MNVTELEIRKKYRYSNLNYVFDVYMECELRANLTKCQYEGLYTGEFRFDYKTWENRLGYSHKQMIRAIKELIESGVIRQVFKGKKGTSSKYFLSRFEEQNEERNEEQNKEQNKHSKIKGLIGVKEQNKEQNKELNRVHSSQHSNLNIISNIYSAKDYEEVWKIYPNKKGKAKSINQIEKILKTITKEELIKTIKRYSREVQGSDVRYILNGSTFFNGRYEDYLDKNFNEQKTYCKSAIDLEEDLL